MYEIREDIKGIIKTLGKKMSDLSRELKINYDTLNAYINGRREMPAGVAEKINTIITTWSDD